MIQNITWKLYNHYWAVVQDSFLANRSLNRLVSRLDDRDVRLLGIPLARLTLTRADYDRILSYEPFALYRKHAFLHRKLLEYLTSFRLITEKKTVGSLCDFASGGDAYSSFFRNESTSDIRIFSIDPLNTERTENGISYIRGDASKIDLPDNSLEAITCHHSIEHFRDQQDITAVREFLRVLRPGGVAVIVPVFLCTRYAEIWNTRPSGHFDKRAETIVDRFSPFPGWSRFEHFARVYDIPAFTSRVLAELQGKAFVELFEVDYEGSPVPDLSVNKGLPFLCEKMLALRIVKQ